MNGQFKAYTKLELILNIDVHIISISIDLLADALSKANEKLLTVNQLTDCYNKTVSFLQFLNSSVKLTNN